MGDVLPSVPVVGEISVAPVPVLKTAPPPFTRFDAASEYRLYPSEDVRVGLLRVSIQNRNQSDGMTLEEWRTVLGAYAAQYVGPRGSSITFVELDFLQRVVWVGHHDEQLNVDLSGRGWALDLVRIW